MTKPLAIYAKFQYHSSACLNDVAVVLYVDKFVQRFEIGKEISNDIILNLLFHDTYIQWFAHSHEYNISHQIDFLVCWI
jgi:RecJ-like exonuclease